jgi:4-hydroxybenzoate polyprenyltransferase
MKKIKNYLSLIKFSHTIFAMPFALIGFALGVNYLQKEKSFYSGSSNSNVFYSIKLLLVICCMIFVRSAAMAFNRYLDRRFDALNPRTAIREIPAGKISTKHALLFTIACCLGFSICSYFINPICFYLSFVALFVVLFYSYTKRFTPLCHLVLGLGLSLAPIGAFLAVTGIFKTLPVLFSVLVICWVSGFDIIYALQDEEFDREHGLNSIPVLMGKKNALAFSAFLHLICILICLMVGFTGHLSWSYWTGALIFIAMLIYQHTLVKPHDLTKVNIAFMTANGIASVLYSVFVIIDLYLHNPFKA